MYPNGYVRFTKQAWPADRTRRKTRLESGYAYPDES
jgi:hypothetical protein